MIDLLLRPLPSYTYDLLALVIILLFAAKGYRRGFFRELCNIAALLFAMMLAVPFGKLLLFMGLFGDVPLLLKSMAANLVGGALAYLFLAIVFAVVLRVLELKREWEGKHKIWVQAGGTFIGIFFGVIIVFLFAAVLLPLGSLASVTTINDQETSPILLPAQLVGSHHDAFADSFLAELVGDLLPVSADVQDGLDVLQALLKDPSLLQLLADHELFQRLLNLPAVRAAIEDPELHVLVQNGSMRALYDHQRIRTMLDDVEVKELLSEIDMQELREVLRMVKEGEETSE